MNTKSRITSVLKTNFLDTSITGIPTFDLSRIVLPANFDIQLPTNLRLGHLAEKIVSESFKASSNYKILYENIQVSEGKRTIGELDFIIEEQATHQLIHLELAYKFYLYDPSVGSAPIDHWIGPNRNDSLAAKLEKLKTKQFPLLFDDCTKSVLSDINLDEISQVLCFLVSLYVPYDCKGSFDSNYLKAIKGYYLDLDTLIRLDNPSKSYYIPTKTEWGKDPAQNMIWTDFSGIEEYITSFVRGQQALLCWEKCEGDYSEFFVVWWKCFYN